MKTFYVFYWKIGASRASAGTEPITVRAKVISNDIQSAINIVLSYHSTLDEDNIIKVEELVNGY